MVGPSSDPGVVGVELPRRSEIRPGLRVRVVQKQDQRSGALTEGVVRDLLTRSPKHPHGIKVRLQDGRVGRVKQIVEEAGADGEEIP
jgi:uncharacterized repeat protein (TIGR03833 family)